jgi:YD repeat-containing protein
MSIYWPALSRSYGNAVVVQQASNARNQGFSSQPLDEPVVEPQAEVSSLLDEYPVMEPSYTEEPNRIVFHTSFGDYGFSKNLPSMSFTYRDRTPLITYSVFYVNSSMRAPTTFSNYTIDRSSLTSNGIAYSATLKGQSDQLGTIRVSVSFDRIERPKITVKVEPGPALSAAGFNVLWIARGPGTVARFKDSPSGLDFSNATRVARQPLHDTKLELGPQGMPDSWRVWAVVDWSDAPAGATVGFGRIEALSFLGGPVAVVTFPANLAYIDPTIVGQSTLTGSALSFQRRTFFDGAYYWAFYHDGSNTVYEYSGDGRTWNNTPTTLWSYQRTAVWFNSGVAYALAGTSTAVLGSTVYLYFRKGTISGNAINWGSIMTVDSFAAPTGYTSAQAEYRDVNLMVGSDGLTTVVYTKAQTYYKLCGRWCEGNDQYWGSRTLQVKKSTDTNGSTWGSATTVLSESSYGIDDATGRAAWYHRYLSILAPSAGNEMMGIYNDIGSIKYSKSSAWASVSTLVSSAKYIEEFGSAVSDSSYKVHLVYVDSSDAIKYASYSGGAWSTPLQIASATSKSPTISLGVGGDLHVLYLRSSVIYYVRCSSFSGWGSATTPFGATFVSPAHLTATANATSDFLVALWTEGTAAPYSIKLGSLPVENAWSPYTMPSSPWDQQGLVPYGHYFRNLGEFVSPYSGLLSIIQTDFSLPGRGSDEPGLLAFTRVFRTPYTFLSGAPYNYENYPYANLGLGWGLNWPWLGTDYVHLWNGQGYKIVWTNNVYENHKGEHFKLTKNADNTFTLYAPSGTAYQFDANKRIASMTDRTHNNQITFNYDSSNRINQITDAVGRTIGFSYDGNGRLATVNSGGRVWTFGYNTIGNLVSVQDPLGRTTSYEYTSSYSGYLLTKITYPTHAYTTYTFSEAQIGTETKSYRVSQQATWLQDGTVVKQVSFAYTTGAADRTTSSTLTTSDGTTVQGYDAYDFSDPSKVTHSTKNGQATIIAKTIDEYDSQGAIKKQTIFPGGGSSSHISYFRFDS